MEYKKIIEYKQNEQLYLSMCLDFDTINGNSEVLIYGKNPKGYQRAPEKNHYNKIKNYILNTKNFVLPTSIILAVDKINLKYFDPKSKVFLKFPKERKIFRTVDGQHRILAMSEAIKDKTDSIIIQSKDRKIAAGEKEKLKKKLLHEIDQLKHFPFNVIVLVTEEEKRSIEMEIFYDINSKGKRIKVDLIELARFNYRILEKSLKYNEINEHISIQVAHYLNEDSNENIWNNAIKFGIHDENALGIIGVNAFRESISGVVDAYLKYNDKFEYRKHSKEKLIQYSQKAAKEIAKFLSQAWNSIIYKKWEFCFKKQLSLDSDSEKKIIYYNSKYYIQRTMGAKALNSILSDAVNYRLDSKIGGLNSSSLKIFQKNILGSRIKSDEWLVGDVFSGYSSESGFKKVSQIILNKIKVQH